MKAEVSLTRNERVPEMSTQKESRYCCVPHCSFPHKEQVSSHRFPTDRGLRDKWVAAIKRACNVGEELQITFGTPVCGKHFKVSDFRWVPGGSRKQLCAGAVPSVFTSKMDTKPSQSPKKSLQATQLTGTPEKASHVLRSGRHDIKETDIQEKKGESDTSIGHSSKNYVTTKECQIKVKEWLIEKLNSNGFPGLVWLNEEKSTFRIPWNFTFQYKMSQVPWEMHPSHAIFKDWATYMSAFKDGNNPSSLKLFMKRALDDNPYIVEDIPKSSRDPYNPFRLFTFRNEKDSLSLRDRSHSYFGPWCRKLGIKQYDILCGKVSVHPKNRLVQNGLVLEVYDYWLKKRSTMQVLYDWLSLILPGCVSRKVLTYVAFLYERKRNHEACSGPEKAAEILSAVFSLDFEALNANFPEMYIGPQHVVKKCKVVIGPFANFNCNCYPGPITKQEGITQLMVFQGISHQKKIVTNEAVLEIYALWKEFGASRDEFRRWLRKLPYHGGVTESVVFSGVEDLISTLAELKQYGKIAALKNLMRSRFTLRSPETVAEIQKTGRFHRHVPPERRVTSFQCRMPNCSRRVRHDVGSKAVCVQQKLCSHHVTLNPQTAGIKITPDGTSTAVVVSQPGLPRAQKSPGDVSNSAILLSGSSAFWITSRAPTKKTAVPHSGWKKLQGIQKRPGDANTTTTTTNSNTTTTFNNYVIRPRLEVCVICNMVLEKPANHMNLDMVVLSSSGEAGQQTVRARLDQVLGHPPTGSGWLCSMCHSTLVHIEEYNCLLALFRVQYQTSSQLRNEESLRTSGGSGGREGETTGNQQTTPMMMKKKKKQKKKMNNKDGAAGVRVETRPVLAASSMCRGINDTDSGEINTRRCFPHMSQILQQPPSALALAGSDGAVRIKQEHFWGRQPREGAEGMGTLVDSGRNQGVMETWGEYGLNEEEEDNASSPHQPALSPGNGPGMDPARPELESGVAPLCVVG